MNHLGSRDELSFTEKPTPLEPRRISQAELTYRYFGDHLHGFLGGIGHDQPIEIRLIDRLFPDQAFGEKFEQRPPEFFSHQHQGKIADLGGLNQRRGFKYLIQSAKSAGQSDECIRIFDQHDFPDKEVAKSNPAVEITIGLLLFRKFNIAADRASSGLFRAAVCRFHDSRTAAGHHGKAGSGQSGAALTRHLIIGMAFAKTGRAEYRHTGTDEMKRAKTAHKLAKYPHGAE